MRNLLAFAAMAVLVFLGLGWYFDWYQVKAVPTGQGHQSFTIDIDKGKISKDVKSLEKTIDQKRRQQAGEEAPKSDKADGLAPADPATPVKLPERVHGGIQ